jgi:prepilin-type N-terminal cleavage/methylation domain-containing protein
MAMSQRPLKLRHSQKDRSQLNQERPMKKNRGVTAVELMIAIAISTILVVAVSAYMRQAQNLSAGTQHSQEVLSGEITTANLLLEDFRSTTRTSLGSLLLNGSFEMQLNGTSPRYWSTALSDLGSLTYELSNTTGAVHNGFHSVKIIGQLGSTPGLDTSLSMTLVPGTAYMVTAWARVEDSNSAYQVSLLNNSNAQIAVSPSASDNLTDWHAIQFRFPSSGVYTANLIPQDLAKIRLSLANGSGPVYFDDVAVTPIKSILVSTDAAAVNVPNVASSQTDPADPAGFRFVRFEDEVEALFRYRIGSNNGLNHLIREKFDVTAGRWNTSGPSNLGNGICELELMYNMSNALPASGKETPLTVAFGLTDKLSQNQHKAAHVRTLTVTPVTQ